MADVFKALADPTRREILLLLMEEQRSIGYLAEQFEMSRPAVAKHVNILQSAKLLRIESDPVDKRQRNCMAQLEAMEEVRTYIQQLDSFWQQGLGRLGDYLAKDPRP